MIMIEVYYIEDDETIADVIKPYYDQVKDQATVEKMQYLDLLMP